jgi:uncharacterized protein YwgA
MKGGIMDFRKHAFVLAIVDCLHENGSWTGKTHVQKSLSLLRDRREIEVPFDFVLYRHGPYSFEVESAIEEMRSYGAIEIEPVPGYGVVLRRGPMARYVTDQGQLSKIEIDAINEVCAYVDGRNVLELERLATASWIRVRENVGSSSEVVKRLISLKPHISAAEAEKADSDVSTWLAAQA